ncbi:MAG TPA: hypothetical protein VEX36_01525 [Thermoleophilaceae bacterium]|nr:hypothetical protein [Thermoleophilaceae bacterium]
MNPGFDAFVAAGPWPQRLGTRALVALARRPRGMALLRLLSPADQLGTSLVAIARYDDPAVSRPLGWDAAAVIARGRTLRSHEGRL